MRAALEALREVCRALGLSGTATTVVPLIVLGLALNLVALSAVKQVHTKEHSSCETEELRSVTRTGLKVMDTVLHSTRKKVDDTQRRWCLDQW
jgi:hypothetical protein